MDAGRKVLSDCVGPANASFRMRVSMFLICLALPLTSSNAQAANASSGQVVNDVRVGPSLPVERPGLERSFDLGVVVIFRNREALEKFERDPRRRGALDAMLQPLVRRYIVFNFAN